MIKIEILKTIITKIYLLAINYYFIKVKRELIDTFTYFNDTFYIFFLSGFKIKLHHRISNRFQLKLSNSYYHQFRDHLYSSHFLQLVRGQTYFVLSYLFFQLSWRKSIYHLFNIFEFIIYQIGLSISFQQMMILCLFFL
jgi:hypothetical protein